MLGNEKQITTMRWVLFWIFTTLFVLIVIATLSMVFLGFGEPTESERNLLFKVFIGEIGVSVVALFYSIFGIKTKSKEDKVTICTDSTEVIKSTVEGKDEDSEKKQKNAPIISIDDKLKNELIRLSISALFSIKLHNKYLLVRGGWIKNHYQPVGGVLKRLPSSYHFLSQLGVLDDDKIPINETTKNDLRIRVPGTSLDQFLEWYESGGGREISPWREFYEEMIRSGILLADKFPHISYEHIKRCIHGIQFSTHFQCQELLIAEIYDLLPNTKQVGEFERLQEKTDERYLWTTEEEIRSEGVIPGINFEANISSHSAWIL